MVGVWVRSFLLSLFLLISLAPDTVNKVLGQPLHLVQLGEVGIGTAHPCQATILHGGPHLHFLQRHEALGVELMPHLMQECHPEGNLMFHTLQMPVEAEFEVYLHPQTVEGVLGSESLWQQS